MEERDQLRRCRDCHQEFVFTAVEQMFYHAQGFKNLPQRCPACRANRRRQREGLAPREMFSVTCSACGSPTMVPFQPRQARPVYCSACFERQQAAQAVAL